MTPTRFHCEWAWLPGGVAADVLIEVADKRGGLSAVGAAAACQIKN